MAIAYTKIKGQGAIESGYLKRIGSEDGYTEISDVFVLDEVKKGSGKDRILLPISPEDKAKEVGEVNVDDVEIL